MEKKTLSLGGILEKDYTKTKSVKEAASKKKKSGKKKAKKSNSKKTATNGTQSGEDEANGGEDDNGEEEHDLVTSLSMYFLQVELSLREEGKERPVKSDFKSRFFCFSLLHSSIFAGLMCE